MFRNHIRLFFRHQKKNKAVAIINLSGLVIGFLSALLILEYVAYQRSFDAYHTKGNRIYRVAYNRYQNEKLQWKTANSFYPTGRWLKENYSEVEDFATLARKYNITVTSENALGEKISLNEAKSYYATSSLLRLFTIVLVEGDGNCLDEPSTVALSESAAKKYFGEENPLGKILTVNQTEKYAVGAVFKDIPSNSHLKSDLLFSFTSLLQVRTNLSNNWAYDLFHTYLLLAPETDADRFCKRALPDMIDKNYKETLDARAMRDEFYLQPLKKIHLYSNIEYETEPPGNAKIINILFGFALFLVGAAWINYINLVTALSVDRARETGIKKINGANRFRLMMQFVYETLLFNLISLSLTLLLFLLVNPLFCKLTNIESYHLPGDFKFLFAGFLVFVAGIILSSIYPSLVLTAYQPITVLKGKFSSLIQVIWFRKGLVTIQFIISLVLLTGTLVAYHQAALLIKKEMGVNYHSTLVIRAPRTADKLETRMDKLLLFKNKLNELPEVTGFTFTSDIPGEEITNFFGGRRKGLDRNDNKGYYQIAVDPQFIDFFNIKLLAGRKFKPEEYYEQRTIIMNRLAADRFGYTNPEEAVGKILVNGTDREWEVVGIVDDFHYRSVKLEPMPTVLTLNNAPKLCMSVKIQTGQKEVNRELLSKLKNCYLSVYPDQPFECISLDEKMATDLKPDKTFASVFSLFSGLAIALAVIGIVALILITIKQNLKAMGVRKALGAQLGDVSQLLSKQVIWQLFTAIVVALPLSYYGYKNWFLAGYLYRIELSVWFFALPVLLVLFSIALVIFVLSRLVIRMKTTEILKYE